MGEGLLRLIIFIVIFVFFVIVPRILNAFAAKQRQAEEEQRRLRGTDEPHEVEQQVDYEVEYEEEYEAEEYEPEARLPDDRFRAQAPEPPPTRGVYAASGQMIREYLERVARGQQAEDERRRQAAAKRERQLSAARRAQAKVARREERFKPLVQAKAARRAERFKPLIPAEAAPVVPAAEVGELVPAGLEDFRRAIVFSEIIQPPVALRQGESLPGLRRAL